MAWLGPLILEPWPGGRWFRDLGDGDGHFWAVVQAIKRPVLLELRGPLFMSYPADNDLQFRIEELDGKTTIRFRQSSFGLIPDEHKGIMIVGSEYVLKRIGERAEASHTT